MLNFKVTFADGASLKLMGLPDALTLDGLRAELFSKTDIPPEDLHGASLNRGSRIARADLVMAAIFECSDGGVSAQAH